MKVYKVYYREDHGWIHAHGWCRIEADSPKEAREEFMKTRRHCVIYRVRKEKK